MACKHVHHHHHSTTIIIFFLEIDCSVFHTACKHVEHHHETVHHHQQHHHQHQHNNFSTRNWFLTSIRTPVAWKHVQHHHETVHHHHHHQHQQNNSSPWNWFLQYSSPGGLKAPSFKCSWLPSLSPAPPYNHLSTWNWFLNSIPIPVAWKNAQHHHSIIIAPAWHHHNHLLNVLFPSVFHTLWPANTFNAMIIIILIMKKFTIISTLIHDEDYCISEASLKPELFLQSPTEAFPKQACWGSCASDKYPPSYYDDDYFEHRLIEVRIELVPSLILIVKKKFSLVMSQHCTLASAILDWAPTPPVTAATMKRKVKVREGQERPPARVDISTASLTGCWCHLSGVLLNMKVHSPQKPYEHFCTTKHVWGK